MKDVIFELQEFNIDRIEDYGSLASSIALENSSDADITVFTKYPLEDRKVNDLLFKVKYKIEAKLDY